MAQRDIDRVQEFRKCIECFLCQDVCHVLRDHGKHEEFIGPRFFVYAANLEMNPLDTEDRVPELKDQHSIGYCNITKCCTKVCPEHIHITDNAIIPLKERVVDRFYDPVSRLLRMVTGGLGFPVGPVALACSLGPGLGAGSLHERTMAYVVFVHGLDNKPEAAYLQQLWKRKLGHDNGLDLDVNGVGGSMVYWADVFYPEPDTNLAAYERAAGDIELCGGPLGPWAPDSCTPEELARFGGWRSGAASTCRRPIPHARRGGNRRRPAGTRAGAGLAAQPRDGAPGARRAPLLLQPRDCTPCRRALSGPRRDPPPVRRGAACRRRQASARSPSRTAWAR